MGTLARTGVWMVALVASIGCGSSPPPKAPGAEPGAMTSEGHEAAAAAEQAEADKHREQAEKVPAGKAVAESAEKSEHHHEAEKHEDASKQHQDAAKATSPK